MVSIFVTIISLLIIVIAYLYFFTQLRKLIKEYKLINSVIDSDNQLDHLTDTPVSDIVSAYKKTISLDLFLEIRQENS